MNLFTRGSRLARGIVAVLALVCASTGALADAGELHAKYGELQEALRNNVYQRPIVINSSDSGDTILGDVYAVLDYPYEVVMNGLKSPGDWCDVLILPFNTKYCHPYTTPDGPNLQMRIGRKADQPVADAYRLDFTWRPVATGKEYFETRMNAGKGPLGTKNYSIVLAGTPLDARHTFIHLSYRYGYGGFGRMAMQTYLNTIGASKIGFTVTGRDGSGQPQYIGGVRGAIERNVMRYYLAIDAYLASLSAPSDQQLDKRIQTWFSTTERYARQLHEMERQEYVAMKRHESERQQALLD